GYGLGGEGYEVERGNDGEEGLEKVALLDGEVMIVEVMMGKVDGYGVWGRVEDGEDIGIILLRVKNDMVEKMVGVEMGGDDYMRKGLEIGEVVGRVKGVMGGVEKRSGGGEDEKSEGIITGGLGIDV
uniref:response regulator n=1 Tax=Paenibacillus xylanexedens TaxID=528191 RepID=UPI0011A7C1BD